MRRLLSKYRYAIIFWLCFGIFRTSLADWNPIPSGSMRPTILEGDVILVNRVAYDLKVPLIKRLVALHADVVGKDNMEL